MLLQVALFSYFLWVSSIPYDIAAVYVRQCLDMFSSKSFLVSGLAFRSFIPLEFIFVCGVKKCSNFILLHVAVRFS